VGKLLDFKWVSVWWWGIQMYSHGNGLLFARTSQIILQVVHNYYLYYTSAAVRSSLGRTVGGHREKPL
jgi:hypothetical protein